MLFLRETFLKRPPLSKRTPLSTKPPIYEQFFHGPSLSKFQKRDTPITLGWGNYADISTAFGRVWHAGLLHKLQSYGISGQIFYLFSVIDVFEWFWMESLCMNIQLMLEFLKATFLVLHFSYYTLMTFLMIFSVILLSMLMILLSTLRARLHETRSELKPL